MNIEVVCHKTSVLAKVKPSVGKEKAWAAQVAFLLPHPSQLGTFQRQQLGTEGVSVGIVDSGCLAGRDPQMGCHLGVFPAVPPS